MTSKKIIIYFLTLFFLISVGVANAQPSPSDGYVPLAPIPGIAVNGKVDINSFITGVITFGIGIAGVLSVIYIMIGGVQYLMTDTVQGKFDGKQTIKNALFGLLLAISSYAILFTINPALVNFNISVDRVRQGGGISNQAGDFGSTTSNGTGSAYDTGCISGKCISLEGSGLPYKGPGLACKNDICYLDADLIEKLQEVNKILPQDSWQITEAFPPTYEHVDDCHKRRTSKSGTCADVALKNIDVTSASSISTVNGFIRAITSQGLTMQYEVTTSTRFNQLRVAGGVDVQFRSLIKINERASGEHAHVEL